MYEILALEREIKEKAKPDFIKICKNVGKKRKRKFRVMTINEHCSKGCSTCEYKFKMFCFYHNVTGINRIERSYKTKDGKYILVEVTNDA